MGQKDTSPPSGSRKEKSQGAAPKVGEQLNREKRNLSFSDQGTLPAARTLLAGGTTITVKGEFFLSYTFGP